MEIAQIASTAQYPTTQVFLTLWNPNKSQGIAFYAGSIRKVCQFKAILPNPLYEAIETGRCGVGVASAGVNNILMDLMYMLWCIMVDRYWLIRSVII